MSILRYKQKVMCADGGVLRDGGGGGGGAPGPSTTYNTNIPEYAKPYVTNMMGATQRQLFNTKKVGGTPGHWETRGGTGDASTQMNYNDTDGYTGARGGAGQVWVEGTPETEEITGFKPYQPYSTNVNDYFAGPSPLMQQAYQAASQLRTPEQIAAGSKLAEQGGLGLLGTAPAASMYGGLGAAYGMGAGQAYENQATSAADVARYMSPYMQNVVDYQKGQALRDFQMSQPVMQAKAAGQGAFGGNRLALQQAEAQRGLMSQLQGIEAQGAQSAFDRAQAAQQYRANLGLQGAQFGTQAGLQGVGAQQAGYQGATQAGSALGNLGSQQIGAQTGIINLQNQLGLQQQQQEQAKINQAIQDYATAQQYPLMQLGFMSNMLRGLPLQATTTQSYQATPGLYQQGVGMIGTLAGAKQAGLFRKGGAVKGLAGGGAIRYADTGAVEANPESGVTRGIQAQLASMTEEQLKQVAATSSSEEIRAMANEMIAKKEIEKQAEQRAQQSMVQQPAMPSQGIASAPAGSMDTLSAAGGGIIAFANRGAVPDIDTLESDEERLARIMKQQELVGITGKPMEGYGKFIADEIAKKSERESQMKGYNLMDIASRFGTIAGGPLYAAQQAVQGASPEIQKRQEAFQTREGQLMKGQAEVENADRLERLGFIKEANAEREKGLNRIKDLEVANINAAASRAAASRPTDLMNIYKIKLAALGKNKDINDPAVQAQAMDQATSAYQLRGATVSANIEGKIDTAHKQIDAAFKDRLAMAEALGDEKRISELKTEIKTAKDAVTKRYNDAATLINAENVAPPAPTTTSGLPATATGPNGEKLYLQPNGNYSAIKPKG